MTFYEAAVEVLRRSGRPLHFKKITEVAIRDELLSHIGKSPESTMESRLEQELKRESDSWIIRTRPGVFVLRDEVADRLNAEQEEEAVEEEEVSEAEEAEEVDELEEEEVESQDDEQEDNDSDNDEDSGSRRRGRSRGRRGRGRSRGRNRNDEQSAKSSDSESDSDSGSDSSSDSHSDSDSDEQPRRKRRRSRGKRPTEANSEAKSEARSESNEDKPNGRESRSRRGRSRGRGRGRNDSKSNDGNQERYDSVAAAAEAALRASGNAMAAGRLADAVFEKKLVKFHTHQPATTVNTAIAVAIQTEIKAGKRPTFASYGAGVWGLVEWGLSKSASQAESSIQNSVSEMENEAVSTLAEALQTAKPEAVEVLVVQLLEGSNYNNLKVAKRTSEGDVFFTADWRKGFSESRVCVQLVCDQDVEVGSDDVSELREVMEHYSAEEAMLFHLGDTGKDAIREARKKDEPNVSIIDGERLAALLVEAGIGTTTHTFTVPVVDKSFVDSIQV